MMRREKMPERIGKIRIVVSSLRTRKELFINDHVFEKRCIIYQFQWLLNFTLKDLVKNGVVNHIKPAKNSMNNSPNNWFINWPWDCNSQCWAKCNTASYRFPYFSTFCHCHLHFIWVIVTTSRFTNAVFSNDILRIQIQYEVLHFLFTARIKKKQPVLPGCLVWWAMGFLSAHFRCISLPFLGRISMFWCVNTFKTSHVSNTLFG